MGVNRKVCAFQQLWIWPLLMLGDRTHATDLTQEVFLLVWRSAGAYQPGGSTRGWVLRLTRAERLVDAAVSAHTHSFMTNHLTDVAASEPRRVEAWFKARLPCAPLVRDLSAQGCTLEGGRMDYLYKRSVAALVYRHGDHLINVFVWPAGRRDAFAGQMLQDDGFHIMFWTRSSTNYCAISDLEQGDFVAFAHSYGS